MDFIPGKAAGLFGEFFKGGIHMEQEMIKAYLNRIGMPEPEAMDKTYLEQLIRAHLCSVPFENLDAADFHMVPELSLHALYEKIVIRKRGGYCFEQNTLFGALLRALGLQVYPVAVRVMWNRDFLPPVSHMGLVVSLEGGSYYCDVGFGGPGPKGLLELAESQQEVQGESFRVARMEDQDVRIDRFHHGEWKTVLRFADREIREPDLQLLNFYCARNEKVRFSHTRVLNLCTPDGNKALDDMELTVRSGGKEEKIVYRNKKELEEGMEKEFGIRVTLPEIKEE